MGERPLPDEVARAARAYLAALVNPSARTDAWHDLLAEVRYWQDDQLVPVLRLAHQVVGQHERVTDEAAVHALVDVGLVEADDLAVVLDASPDTARDLWARVDRAQVDRAQEVGDPEPVIASALPSSTEGATARSFTEASDRAIAPALRIGFDDLDAVDVDVSDDRSDDDSEDWDDSDDWDDEPSGGLVTYRRLVGVAVVVWVLVVVAWWLGGA